MFRACTKHIEVDYHFIRDKVFNKDIIARYISTHDQPSDIFTKGLSKARFILLRSKLMIASLPINLRGNVNSMISTLAASTKNGCQVNYATHHAADHEDHVSDHKVSTDMAKKLYLVRKALSQISRAIFDSCVATSHTRKGQTMRDFILHNE